MNIMEMIKGEHEGFEREIIEIETIMEEPVVNYSNLIHVLKKVINSLHTHLDKEERVFAVLENRGMNTPLQSLRADRVAMARLINSIFKAISSGSDFKVREALNNQGIEFMSRVRGHIKEQEWIFCALPEEYMPSHAEVGAIVQNLAVPAQRKR